PSASVSQQPWASVMKRGVPPTALNARTGEFTPPGMTGRASWKSFAEMAVPRGDDAGRVAAREEAGPSDLDTSTSVPAAGSGFTTGGSCRDSTSVGRQVDPREGRNAARAGRWPRLARKPLFRSFDGGGLG